MCLRHHPLAVCATLFMLGCAGALVVPVQPTAGRMQEAGLPSIEVYEHGTHGWISLDAGASWVGRERTAAGMRAIVQFYPDLELSGGGSEELDPLTGHDDCGVYRNDWQPQSLSPGRLVAIERGAVIRARRRIALQRGPQANWPTYHANLTALLPPPAAEGEFAIELQGGPFERKTMLSGIRVPAALSLPELERMGMLPRGALRLTWTGARTGGIIDGRFVVSAASAEGDGGSEALLVRCLLRDDGAFTVPDEVMARLPERGTVDMHWSRGDRRIVEVDGRRIRVDAVAYIEHRLEIGGAVRR